MPASDLDRLLKQRTNLTNPYLPTPAPAASS